MKSFVTIFLIILLCSKQQLYAQLGPHGPNDTIRVLVYKVGLDSFAYFYMPPVSIASKISEAGKLALAERSRLRRYIEKVYPLAIRASDLINEIRASTAVMESRKEKRQFKKQNEKKVKDEFTDQIKNLYIGEGKILTKLIYRETGATCYDIIKEMKTGINARFWQTISFFFNGNLKQKYDPSGEDADMEIIVKEVARWYGRG